jgi:methionyl-tRNA synthetase
MAAGLAPARRVFAHGWWTIEGEKMSKSLRNAIDPLQLIGKYGLDQVRYFLLREVPFGQDGDFSHRALVGRINADLANGLGNLAQRSLSMIAKNCDGKLPQPGPFAPADEALLGAAADLIDRVRAELDQQAFHRALEAIWQVVGQGDRYIDEQAPWSLRKTDIARMGTVLYVVAETVRRVAVLIQPFMPTSAGRLLDQLGVAPERRGFTELAAGWALEPGSALPKPEGVFPRYLEA